MNRNTGLSIVWLALVAGAQAQQAEPAKPLGDVAREQLQAKKREGKPTAAKVYTEVGTAPEAKDRDDKEKEKEKDKEKNKDGKDKTEKAAAMPAHRSLFDQGRSRQPDFIIIPAGTEIRVDIVESKVIVPVRVGFSTPIPPLSIVAVKLIENYFAPVSYNIAASASGNAPVIYGESAELTSVTVRGVSYPVQATRVALNGGATFGTAGSISSSRDAVFVLTAPLPIER